MSTNVKKTNTDKLNILTSRFFFTIVQYRTDRTTPVNSRIYRQIREILVNFVQCIKFWLGHLGSDADGVHVRVQGYV